MENKRSYRIDFDEPFDYCAFIKLCTDKKWEYTVDLYNTDTNYFVVIVKSEEPLGDELNAFLEERDASVFSGRTRPRWDYWGDDDHANDYSWTV